MPNWRRASVPGGTFFFTLVSERRSPILCTDLARPILHRAIEECANTRPMKIHAMVLFPDHLHLLAELPDGDGDYSTRLRFIKSQFTREFLAAGGTEQDRSASRVKNVIRDREDFNAHMDYIHFNPVKHGAAACPHEYAYSMFGRAAEKGLYEADWMCSCAKIAIATVGKKINIGAKFNKHCVKMGKLGCLRVRFFCERRKLFKITEGIYLLKYNIDMHINPILHNIAYLKLPSKTLENWYLYSNFVWVSCVDRGSFLRQ